MVVKSCRDLPARLDLQALLEDRNKELSSLQEKYYQLENDISMRNIDAKFEPYVANNDIRDDDYSRYSNRGMNFWLMICFSIDGRKWINVIFHHIIWSIFDEWKFYSGIRVRHTFYWINVHTHRCTHPTHTKTITLSN